MKKSIVLLAILACSSCAVVDLVKAKEEQIKREERIESFKQLADRWAIDWIKTIAPVAGGTAGATILSALLGHKVGKKNGKAQHEAEK